jgi:hypothetical protein
VVGVGYDSVRGLVLTINVRVCPTVIPGDI